MTQAKLVFERSENGKDWKPEDRQRVVQLISDNVEKPLDVVLDMLEGHVWKSVGAYYRVKVS